MTGLTVRSRLSVLLAALLATTACGDKGNDSGGIDTRAVGMVVVALGGGRTRPQDPVDHAVGLTWLAGPGEQVGPDRPLAIVHARTEAQVQQATGLLRAAYRLSGKAASAQAAVLDRITA